MARLKLTTKQVNQYDKVLKENIEEALPGLIKTILHIQVLKSEELPDDLQHTKERKPDVLKKIIDKAGETFVLHIEFQTKDDLDMAFRMADYFVMLSWLHRIPVKQYVIFIGEGKSTMPNNLSLGSFNFDYQLISISLIDYRIFLNASSPEEKMFALLADFGKENVEDVVTTITSQILQASKGDLEKERRKNQLRVLAQLRTLVSENIEIMEHVSSFFKEEKDIFYQVGEKKGIEKGEKQGIQKGAELKSFEFVKNLLVADRFTITEIANFANVTEAFVLKVTESLGRKSASS